MIRNLLVAFVFCGFALNGIGQSRIEFKMQNYASDTLVLGYYFADKQLVKDSILRTNDKFIYESEDSLVAGVYMLLLQDGKDYIQFMVNDDEQQFDVNLDADDLGNPTFTNSSDNTLFYDYLRFLNKKKPKAGKLREEITRLEALGKSSEKEQAEIDKLNKEVTQYQEDLVKNNPGTVTALLIKSNLNVEAPEFQGTEEEISLQRYAFYRAHYLDNVELHNPTSLYLPSTAAKIDIYLKNLTIQHPDSLIITMDYLLEKMEGSQKLFRYYLSQFVNESASGKRVGMDAVYVHLADKYYAKGKAPWTKDETLKKILNEASALRPILIGKTAPDVTLFKQDGTPVTLSEIDADYKVVIFWAPNCPHCSKAMPPLLEFYQDYKEKGVEVISVCTKMGKKLASCWESIEKKNMGQFLNLGDELGKSRFKSKYFVKKTPMIYVLDRDLKILVKELGAEHLGTFMDDIIKSEEEQKELPR